MRQRLLFAANPMVRQTRSVQRHSARRITGESHMIDQVLTGARMRVLAMAFMAAAMLQPGLAQAQDISTVAGNGGVGFSGDGGPATSASLNTPLGMVVDAAGNTYIADLVNNRIRKVTPAGVISTVVGNGTYGYSGDGGPATAASISHVYKLAMDSSGNVFLADHGNQRIRKVTPGGTISTIAGIGTSGYTGDGGPATSARLNGPIGMAVDAAGNVYFSDLYNHVVRKIALDGTISTVAGNGIAGFSGDGALATSAQLNQPISVSIDGGGRLYIADIGNQRIRKVDAGGVISTLAGNGNAGFSGDGNSATAARLWGPWDAKPDASGNVYIADSANHRIRKVDTSGVISTFAGNGAPGYGGDGGPAISAQLSDPRGIDVTAGNVRIADTANHRIRLVALFTSCAAEGFTGSKLTLCRQVCEIDQTPARLLSLIKLYRTAYREDPPCAQ